MDINMAQEHQKKTGATNFWNYKTFSELMKYSPKEAAKYVLSCKMDTEIMGLPAQEFIDKCELEEKRKELEKEQEIAEIKRKNDEINKELVTDYVEDTELKIEDLQELLKDNDIKFHPASGIKKLIEIAKENNLI